MKIRIDGQRLWVDGVEFRRPRPEGEKRRNRPAHEYPIQAVGVSGNGDIVVAGFTALRTWSPGGEVLFEHPLFWSASRRDLVKAAVAGNRYLGLLYQRAGKVDGPRLHLYERVGLMWDFVREVPVDLWTANAVRILDDARFKVHGVALDDKTGRDMPATVVIRV